MIVVSINSKRLFLIVLLFSSFLPISAGAAICSDLFTKDLKPYDRDPEVFQLQRVLNHWSDTTIKGYGLGSPGHETKFFGLDTRDAVVRFQEKYADEILRPNDLTRGTGFVGTTTRNKLNELCLDTMALVSSSSTDQIASLPVAVPPWPERLSRIFVGSGGLWSFFLAIFLVFGVNLIFWSLIGVLRILSEKLAVLGRGFKPKTGAKSQDLKIKVADVAALIPAHNEALVITETLLSLSRLLKPENMFVISDGSSDQTAQIAKAYGAQVLELKPGRGKAGALAAGLAKFKIAQRYQAVLLVDADTRLKPDYLLKSLPFFNDPQIVAVAGYATTIWQPKGLSWQQLLFITHRDRVYFLTQNLVKFGQTWKYTNVTAIVPGFASIYRTTILDQIDINPPGLVIEDFNMTFEVHHKRLGKIAHHPSAIAYTQDPDNLKDYFQQIKRWHLGFWQTIKLHGVWSSAFWLALALTLFEVISGSLVFLLLPLWILAAVIPFNPWQPFLLTFLIGILLADYLLTILTAVVQSRPHYLLLGFLFPLVRIIDAVAFLSSIPRAFLIKSNGRWVSPTRRAG